MKEIDMFCLVCVGFSVVLLLLVILQNFWLIKIEKKNSILKGIIDKLTNENVRLIEELYER